MSIDPIALSKTGSIEQSTYARTAPTAPSATTSGTTAASSGSTTETSNTSNTAGTPTVSSSAFIVDKSLAALLDFGSKGLSGAQLATYNSQALLTQNTGSLIADLGSGGDSFTSEVVGSSSSWSLYRTMQSAAANSGTSTGEAEAPVRTTFATPSDGTSEEAAEPSGSAAVFDDILETSQAVYGTGSTVKATTTVPEATPSTTTTATTQTNTTSQAPTGSAAVFDDILKTSQALYGSSLGG